MPTLHLVYLDRDHLSDPVFLNTLAQTFAKVPPAQRTPMVLVHGSGEKVERTLEADGRLVERTDAGTLPVTDPADRQLVERAVRETNKQILSALADEVVPAVGIQGTDRGVLRRTDDGGLTTGPLGWVEALLSQHVLPVMSTLAPPQANQSTAEEAAPAQVLQALAKGWSDRYAPVLTFIQRADWSAVPDGLSADALDASAYSEPAVVRSCLHAAPIRLTRLEALLNGDSASQTPVGE
ncbi:acetylglutamate kinase [Salisaeta longa]|uniref:acetylglutamate kinase n=1 Tax=Salisaeta longa TaxID=503170 RepID=UPI0003B6C3A3|nr:acetylglutamate kinase [Salisaeta longa]